MYNLTSTLKYKIYWCQCQCYDITIFNWTFIIYFSFLKRGLMFLILHFFINGSDVLLDLCVVLNVASLKWGWCTINLAYNIKLLKKNGLCTIFLMHYEIRTVNLTICSTMPPFVETSQLPYTTRNFNIIAFRCWLYWLSRCNPRHVSTGGCRFGQLFLC